MTYDEISEYNNLDANICIKLKGNCVNVEINMLKSELNLRYRFMPSALNEMQSLPWFYQYYDK